MSTVITTPADGKLSHWRLDHESDYLGECSCCFDYDNKCNLCIGLGLHNWLCRRTAFLSMQLSSSGYGCVCQTATWGSYAEMPAAKSFRNSKHRNSVLITLATHKLGC